MEYSGSMRRLLSLLTIAILAPVSALGAAKPKEDSGAKLYEQYCQPCHGAEMKGYAADNAPSLVSPTFRATADDAFLRIAIARGRAGTAMAGYAAEYGGPLSPAQIDTLMAYVRGGTEPETLTPQPSKGSPGYGARLFRAYCESCHGTEKARGNAVHLANAMFLESASDAFLRAAILQGRPGTPMEPWQGKLTPQEVEDLVAYLRSLAVPVPPPPAAAAKGPALGNTAVVINPDGNNANFSVRDGFFVPVAEVAKAYDEGKRLVLVDARPTSDYLRSHITGAISIPYFDTTKIDRIPNDGTWIITYCACPHHLSRIVRDALYARGYKNVAILDEGVFAWQQAGHPMFVEPGQLPIPAPPVILVTPTPR